MLSLAQIKRLEIAVKSSLESELRTKLPAELTLAQWALESGWGAHQPGNNCFGIKSYAGCYGIQMLSTIEYVNGVGTAMPQAFATFPSLEACFEHHAALFTKSKSYAKAWSRYLADPNLETLIREIAVTYATDPGYADRLLQILAMTEVRSALAAGREASRRS